MKKGLFLLLFLFCILNLFSQKPQKFYNVQNLNINSEYADFGVTFYKDSLLLFASSKKDKTINRKERSYNRMEYLQFYKGRIQTDGQIIGVTKFSTEKFNLFHESDITFTKDYKNIYFTFNNYINNEYRKKFLFSMTKKHILNIFKGSINENGIVSDLSPLPFNEKNYSISQPRLSPDGKILFFISDKEDSYGGTDIYKVEIYENGEYGEPKNLGPKINTAGNEMFPFLNVDNTFYFSSDGHRGKGGLDIFSSKMVDDKFSQVENLNQLNYTDDDFAFVIKEELNVGYFSSVRKGNKGNVDIFSFNIKSIECNQSIAGIVKNNKSKKSIANASIVLIQEGVVLEEITTITDGSFKFDKTIDCNSVFTIIARHVDYESTTIEIKTDSEILKVNNVNIELIKIEVAEKFIADQGVIVIKTDPINFDLNKSEIREDAAIELNKVVKIMKENPK